MKKTFPSFDLGIDHLFPSEERKQKKEEQQRFACIDVSKLDDLVEGAQAKTTKYATKYTVNVFKVIFAFKYYNIILKITFCFLRKICNKIKRQLYATVCECEICSNQISLGGSFAVFWVPNVKKITIKTWKNGPDSLPE